LNGTGVQEITVPNSFTGDTVQAFIGFFKNDGSEVSNSKYLGEVVVA
jgi:hypothetical protein